MLSKSFLHYFRNDNNASKLFTHEIWMQIKALFSPCCGMGRKLVGLKDADGNKISINGFPFTFDGVNYPTKETFETAMAIRYGAGYSTNLVDCCHLVFIWNRGLTEVPNDIVEVPITYNFDVENIDWSDIAGVINQTSFENYLITSSGFSTLTVTDFVYSTTRIKCNISNVTGSTELYMSGINITKINKLDGFGDLTLIEILSNQMTEFNPQNNLPTTLTEIYLSTNQITAAGYIISEAWANAQPSFSSNCNIVFSGNPNSVSGTNLETILISKNCTVTT